MLTPLEKTTGDLLDGTSRLQCDGTSILQWDGRSTSTLFNGKPALGQELGVPSRLCQQMPGLEAGRALLQGCKAVGDPFPLRVVFALDIFINLFSRTAADCPHQPKAFPPLPRHIETLATSLPGNLEKGRWISLERPFAYKVSALEKDLRHSRHDFFLADLATVIEVTQPHWWRHAIQH